MLYTIYTVTSDGFGFGVALVGFWNWERLNFWLVGSLSLSLSTLSRKEKMLSRDDLTFIILDHPLVTRVPFSPLIYIYFTRFNIVKL